MRSQSSKIKLPRLFLLLFLLLFIILTLKMTTVHADMKAEDLEGYLKEIALDCQKQFPLMPHEVIQILQRKVPESQSGACFLACLCKKGGLIDEFGRFSKEPTLKVFGTLYSVIEKQQVEGVVDTCIKGNRLRRYIDGSCELTRSVLTCIMDGLGQLVNEFHMKTSTPIPSTEPPGYESLYVRMPGNTNNKDVQAF